MPHSPEEKKQALVRVRRIKGQIAALEQAIENEAECSSLLQQLASVRGAVKGLMTVVLESYLREEFPDTNKRRRSQTKSINDAISVVRSYLR
ncbi:formaldehyde-responsive transcriptional repressor FrmR [Klebsiella pneumoniae]|uniref:formaldehyde-responsive transcriptional repressor FrmR n=1 Tax=Enterobacteriaceae TaxID=543 RepID=UPI0009BA1715|nr:MULTISPECIES: formaldehyde-responsive transcriptional repressor FrmR [Enterobacteriaceae]MDX8988770.1 formaldehyde-responsive transcriptional repressor FrmR [Salmonella enterica]MEA1549836.1 formaldehyde-responsive transcriptional repressor FrmR [Salmonella enterica subsp. enterica serovar Minnesota]EIW9295142.1 formaldehyde-responsive transcriptional repressor FrmR [Klebsiella pneumoniae]EKX6964953.1 formaldehyde-responsive transcriptional repressor FrmR [Klebsiella pneumoniae]MBA0059328.1